MVRDIRNVEKSMGEEGMFISESVSEAKVKLERSVASLRDIMKGETITEEDLHMLSPGDGFKWDERGNIIGKVTKQDIPKDEIIYKHMIK